MGEGAEGLPFESGAQTMPESHGHVGPQDHPNPGPCKDPARPPEQTPDPDTPTPKRQGKSARAADCITLWRGPPARRMQIAAQPLARDAVTEPEAHPGAPSLVRAP